MGCRVKAEDLLDMIDLIDHLEKAQVEEQVVVHLLVRSNELSNLKEVGLFDYWLCDFVNKFNQVLLCHR